MKKILILSTSLAASLVMVQASAQGLDKFSRACRFDQIPAGLKYVSNKFFLEVGAPPELGDLYSKSTFEQSFYWINESLTTDYYTARYYLFAKSNIYGWGTRGPANQYNLVHSFRSRWTLQEVTERIKNDPLFSPHYANRGPAPFYSARAGDPNILVRWYQDGNTSQPASLNGDLVAGRHQALDAKSGSVIDLGITNAKNCNLPVMGFGLFNR